MITARPNKAYTVGFRADKIEPSYYTLLNVDGSTYKEKTEFTHYFSDIAVTSFIINEEWEGLIRVENSDNTSYIYDIVSVSYPMDIFEGAGE